MTKKFQHHCYTCHKVFDSSDDLRSHVQYFQYEIQELLARLVQSHAHLPSSETSFGDDSDNENIGHDLNSVGVYRCPDPKCPRRKSFQDKKGLDVHYQKHVKCLEPCVCGSIFTNARAFIRHRCKGVAAKISRERNKYWRSVCEQKLAALEKQRAPTGLSVSSNRKRTLDETEPLPNPPSKRHQVSDSINHSGADGSHEAVYLHDPTTLSPSLSVRISGTVSNPLPAPQASVSVSDGLTAPSLVPESMTAPIFWDHTIPPLPIMQPPNTLCFPSNTTLSTNTKTPQLDTSAYYTLSGPAD